MAKRTNTYKLDVKWKERIRIGVIMDRLIKCIHGELEMTPAQLKAADLVLKKVVPDLARTELTGDEENPIQTINTIKIEYVDPKHSDA